ncbi:MAG: sugar transferase (PEP-CTERM/EpsH1 system associated) [Planctomycetota bacterium]|jgi:sugar transferase (PEP-CTERM/EpsH1 system associated)
MDILYLVHRIPYPPDKGDKIRSFRWLVHLAEKHRVHLVTLYDDPQDLVHLDAVSKYCATLKAFRLKPLKAKVRAMMALAGSRPLSLPYFFHPEAKKAVVEILQKEPIDLALIYSSSMGQYTEHLTDIPRILDMVDVDSAKFASYAELGSGVGRKIYGLEARRLARYEEEQVRTLDRVILCTEPEAELLSTRVNQPNKVVAIGNGAVPPDASKIPASRDSTKVIFVGAMDYQPNIDAVNFAAQEIMPLVRQEISSAEFIIVGRDPTAEVRKLGQLPGVTVTGPVADIDDYLRDACLSLVPLRIAQGIQNKVLEAMAWSLPVVTNKRIAISLESDVGNVLCSAETAEEYAAEVIRLIRDKELRQEIGQAAREFVIKRFSWEPRLAQLDQLIEEVVHSAKVKQ